MNIIPVSAGQILSKYISKGKKASDRILSNKATIKALTGAGKVNKANETINKLNNMAATYKSQAKAEGKQMMLKKAKAESPYAARKKALIAQRQLKRKRLNSMR